MPHEGRVANEDGTWACDMRKIDASNIPRPLLARMLHNAREPVLVLKAMEASKLWTSREEFIARFGTARIEVTHSGSHGFEWATPVKKWDHRYILGGQTSDARIAKLSLSELDEAMTNGSASADTYCFHDVMDEAPLMTALDELSTVNDHLLVHRHGPTHWDASSIKEFLSSPERRRGIRGGAYFTMGVASSGGPFHTHTDALLGVFAGRKRWFISRNGSHVDLSADEFDHGRARQVIDKLHPHQYWICEQGPGELMWVPEGLVRARPSSAHHPEATAHARSHTISHVAAHWTRAEPHRHQPG